MTATSPRTATLLDIAERTVLTYLEAFLGLLLAAGTTDLVDLTVWQTAAISAIPAGLAVVKGSIGTVLGRPGTASWLPAHTDPTAR